MQWRPFLKDIMEGAYSTTDKLLAKVDPNALDWKPGSGSNWMTVGQLLKHLSEGCGAGFRAFVTGDWGLPEGMKIEDLKPEEMLPPAEKLPRIDSVEEARNLLAGDKVTALAVLDGVSDQDLDNRMLAAPWAPAVQMSLGRHFYQMVEHLERHKSQLFYYLKLQGKRVDTGDLWGA